MSPEKLTTEGAIALIKELLPTTTPLELGSWRFRDWADERHLRDISVEMRKDDWRLCIAMRKALPEFLEAIEERDRLRQQRDMLTMQAAFARE